MHSIPHAKTKPKPKQILLLIPIQPPQPLPLPAYLPTSLPSRTQDLTPNDPDLLHRPIAPSRLHTPQLLHNLHAINHMPKDSMSAVQMPRRGQRDKKLASVGIGPSVRHAEDSGCGVGELGDDFVGESAAVDGGAAAAGAGGVAGLDHEVADDAVGGDGVVVACCGEGGEVVAGLGRGQFWDDVFVLFFSWR